MQAASIVYTRPFQPTAHLWDELNYAGEDIEGVSLTVQELG